MADDRIITNRPRSLTALTNKYGPGSSQAPFLSSLPNPTLAALKRYDATRANLGQAPLTASQTKVAGTAAAQHRAVTPTKDEGWLKDAVSDITDIVGSIPKLPVALANEALELPTIGDRWSELQAQNTGNPLEALGNAAQLPGVRMLPGSFVVSQFGSGGEGIGGLTEHPVFTALDVLPYASKAARATPTFRAAQEAAERAAVVEGAIPRRVTPIGANLRSFPHTDITPRPSPTAPGLDVPTIARNRLGRGMESLARTVGSTGLGNTARQGFSPLSRRLAMETARIGGETIQTTPDTPLKPFRGDPRSDAAAALRSQADEVAELGKDLDPARRVEVAEIAGRGDPTELQSLTPEEIAYATAHRTYNDAFVESLIHKGPDRVPADSLARRNVGGADEIYHAKAANRIDDARYDRDAQLAVYRLRDALDPDTPTLLARDEAIANIQTILDDVRKPKRGHGGLSPRQKKMVIRGHLQALDAQGYDVRAARKALDGSAAERANVPNLVPDTPTRTPDPVITANRSKAWRNKLGKTREGFSDSLLRRNIKQADAIEARVVPARWEDLIRERWDAETKLQLQQSLQGDQLNRALDYLERGYRQELQADPNIPVDLKEILEDVRTSWQDLRAQGFDPQFRHRVFPGSENEYQFARITGKVPDLKQTKARLWDATPNHTPFEVSLNHRAMEVLVNRGRQFFVDDFLVGKMARPESSLRASRIGLSEQTGKSLETLIEKEWVPLDESLKDWGVSPSRGTIDSADRLYIPREIAENLKRMRTSPGEIGRAVESVTKPWRTSIIALSPRLQLYNAVGNAILTMGRAPNPVTVFRYFNDARKIIKEVEGPAGLAGSNFTEGRLGRTLGNLTDAERDALRNVGSTQRQQLAFGIGAGDEFANRVAKLPKKQQAAALHNTMAGATMERWLKTAWEAGATKTLRQGVNWTTAKMMWANDTLDNMSRAMVFMDEATRGINKGLSREAAFTRGAKAVRETLQNFDSMTPIERTTMRYLMPFWSFARTAIRYALTYPGDHPWRMSIIASLARAGLEDFNTGLPQYMKSWLFLGDTRTDGTVNALNLDGMNPFGDVANYFTLTGFLKGESGPGAITSQLNPLLSTGFQSMGIDTFTGQADLFPEVEYDPRTGSLVAKPKEGIGTALVGNLLPPARILLAVTGRSNEYKELLRRDPQAAARYLVSAAALPSWSREVNIPEATIKAELGRYEGFRKDVSGSLKSGDIDGLAERYPGLKALRDRVNQLTPQQRAQFNPNPGMAGAETPGYGELFAGAAGAVIPG